MSTTLYTLELRVPSEKHERAVQAMRVVGILLRGEFSLDGGTVVVHSHSYSDGHKGIPLDEDTTS